MIRKVFASAALATSIILDTLGQSGPTGTGNFTRKPICHDLAQHTVKDEDNDASAATSIEKLRALISVPDDRNNNLAVSIGNNFPNNPVVSYRLHNAANDAYHLAGRFHDLGFDTLCIINANSETIENAANLLRETVETLGSIGVFYVASHGHSTARGDTLIAGANSEFTIPLTIERTKFVSNQALVSSLTPSPPSDDSSPPHIILIPDVCRTLRTPGPIQDRDPQPTPISWELGPLKKPPSGPSGNLLLQYTAEFDDYAEDLPEQPSGRFIQVLLPSLAMKNYSISKQLSLARNELAEVKPDKNGHYRYTPAKVDFGGSTGFFEWIAFDDRNSDEELQLAESHLDQLSNMSPNSDRNRVSVCGSLNEFRLQNLFYFRRVLPTTYNRGVAEKWRNLHKNFSCSQLSNAPTLPGGSDRPRFQIFARALREQRIASPTGIVRFSVPIGKFAILSERESPAGPTLQVDIEERLGVVPWGDNPWQNFSPVPGSLQAMIKLQNGIAQIKNDEFRNLVERSGSGAYAHISVGPDVLRSDDLRLKRKVSIAINQATARLIALGISPDRISASRFQQSTQSDLDWISEVTPPDKMLVVLAREPKDETNSLPQITVKDNLLQCTLANACRPNGL